MDEASYKAQVRAQYERYPFPRRDPRDEARRLIRTEPDLLSRLDHHLFGGRRDFTQPLRVLVAGGGTGDALVYLAEQLRGTPAEFTYLDMSAASQQVARARIHQRGLGPVRWVQASLLELDQLDLGPFDYINCVGVLHHLEDPDAGLAQLAGVLADDGGMALMLYGRYGRKDVYVTQRLLRLLDGGQGSLPQRIDRCRATLLDLAAGGRVAIDEGMRRSLDSPHFDTYLLDTYLHDQDRAYSAEDIHQLLDGAQLHLAGFTNYFDRQGQVCALNYDPSLYLGDAELRAVSASQPLSARQHLAELLNSRISMHAFYASRRSRAAAQVRELDLAPYFPTTLGQDIVQTLIEDQRQTLPVRLVGGVQRTFTLGSVGLAMLEQLDGRTATGDLCLRLSRAHSEQTRQQVVTTVLRVLQLFVDLGLVQLRDPALPALPMRRVERTWDEGLNLRAYLPRLAPASSGPS